jgi:hypothetical protein
MKITLEEAAHGLERDIEVPTKRPAPDVMVSRKAETRY